MGFEFFPGIGNYEIKNANSLKLNYTVPVTPDTPVGTRLEMEHLFGIFNGQFLSLGFNVLDPGTDALGPIGRYKTEITIFIKGYNQYDNIWESITGKVTIEVNLNQNGTFSVSNNMYENNILTDSWSSAGTWEDLGNNRLRITTTSVSDDPYVNANNPYIEEAFFAVLNNNLAMGGIRYFERQ